MVTPAWQRFTLTRICLEQRARACEELRADGLDATCIVVADDANAKTAREFGFEVVHTKNDLSRASLQRPAKARLGGKFNDGFYAAAKLGYDYVVAVGSDQFISPVMFDDIPRDRVIETAWFVHRAVAIVPVTGDRYLRIWIDTDHRTGPSSGGFRTMPVASLKHCGYRPSSERISRGCDLATWRGGYRGYETIEAFGDPLEVVNFQSHGVQVTDWGALCKRWQNGSNLVRDPWLADLRRLYPDDLVDRILEYYLAGADGSV